MRRILIVLVLILAIYILVNYIASEINVYIENASLLISDADIEF